MIVFCHYIKVLDEIQAFLEDQEPKQLKYVRIDGATDTSSRQKLCSVFQSQDNCKVALLSIRASSVCRQSLGHDC